MRPKVTVYSSLWFALTKVVATFKVLVVDHGYDEYQPVLDKLLEAKELFNKTNHDRSKVK